MQCRILPVYRKAMLAASRLASAGFRSTDVLTCGSNCTDCSNRTSSIAAKTCAPEECGIVYGMKR